MKTHFVTMAKYNAWANARLFRTAGALQDALYRRDVGTYFKSLHGKGAPRSRSRIFADLWRKCWR